MCYILTMANEPKLTPAPSRSLPTLITPVLPQLVANGDTETKRRFVEFFVAHLRTTNTRSAYARTAVRFLEWCRHRGVHALNDIQTLHVAEWIRMREGQVSAPTVKQELAAVRKLFDWLAQGGILAMNPATVVRGPAHSARSGKTPVLSTEEARLLLASIPDTTICAIRDRTLIAMMIYSFARISAALGMNVADVYRENHRLRLRFREKGGKEHQMPCHHRLEGWLAEYLEAGGLAGDDAVPLFQTIGRGTAKLSGRRLSRHEAWQMVRKRAAKAGIETRICNHTFRGTGITAYLEHPDAKIEEAQKMAGHSDPKTTGLYDRRTKVVTQQEVERIRI